MANSIIKSNIPSEEQLLDALDTEIAYIKSEQQRPGWTTWAILGGLAVVVWHLLIEWENGFSTATAINVFTWFLTFSLLHDTIYMFKLMVSSDESQHKSGTRYFIYKEKFAEARLTLFLFLIRYTILIAIVFSSLLLFNGIIVLLHTFI